MCQAYEAERNSISYSKDYETKQGWIAHYAGKHRDNNPHLRPSSYRYKSWQHGWDCRDTSLAPWSLQRKWREINNMPCEGDPTRDEVDTMLGLKPQ